MIRRALVIGASGQVGRCAASALRERGWEVVGTSASRPATGLEPLDLRNDGDVRSLVARVRPGVCVLSSALTNVDRREVEPDVARRLNAMAPAIVAEAVRESGGKTFFLLPEYVFDGVSGPYSEDSPTGPTSVYGATKLDGERAILAADPANLAIRTTVVFSYHPGDKNFVMQLLATLGAGRRMRVPSDQVSSPTYAPDLGVAIADLAERPGVTGILHVAGPDIVDRYALALAATRALELPPDLLDPVETASLGQKACRPLRAGLLTTRLRTMGNRMRGVEEALTDLRARSRLGPGTSPRVSRS